MSKTVKPSKVEDDFFAREEVEKLRKLHAEHQAQQTQAQKDEQKKLHHMRCPKCGSELTEVTFRSVTADRCFSCNGMWLDAGEIEHLAGHEPTNMTAVLDFFFKK